MTDVALQIPLVMQWTAPITGIAMCQSAVAVVELRESAYGYTLPSRAATDDGCFPPTSGSSSQYRLLYP